MYSALKYKNVLCTDKNIFTIISQITYIINYLQNIYDLSEISLLNNQPNIYIFVLYFKWLIPYPADDMFISIQQPNSIR